MTVPNPFAFPHDRRVVFDERKGMTLRDWFAGQVLPYAASRSYGNDWGGDGKKHPELVASFSYRVADAMLAERDRHAGEKP